MHFVNTILKQPKLKSIEIFNERFRNYLLLKVLEFYNEIKEKEWEIIHIEVATFYSYFIKLDFINFFLN